MSISISGSGGITGATDYTFDNNVSIGGTLTYEDVANIDAVGVVTARQGVVIGTGASVGNPANNELGLYTNSVERARILSDGAVIISDGTNWTKYVSDANFQVTDNTNAKIVISNPGNRTYSLGVGTDNALVFKDEEGTVETFRVTYTNQFLKGTTSSRSNWDNTSGNDPALQVEGSGAASHMSVTNIEDNTSGSSLYLGKTRGSAYQIASNNDTIGEVSFQGADGNEMVAGASIVAQVDNTPGGNDMPGRILFNTTADGASTPTERMRIDSTGRIILPAGSPGISFNGNDTSASTVSSKTLDDYEVGTWTATISFDTGTTGIAYDSNRDEGHYVKIGKQVFAYFRVMLTSKGSSTGTIRLNGLPFPVADTFSSTSHDGQLYLARSSGFNSSNVGANPVGGFAPNGNTYAIFQKRNSNGDSVQLNNSDIQNDWDITGVVQYFTT
jgi:uncharacterized protein YaiE (UPF0345 family)